MNYSKKIKMKESTNYKIDKNFRKKDYSKASIIRGSINECFRIS
jgi:hypothetical protein